MRKINANESLDIFISPVFLTCLFLLLVNDFLLKEIFHNWFTGKLSDFAGLFVFPLFWIGLFPDYRKRIFVITALGFVYWKTPYADSFIELWNSIMFYEVGRVIDYTDYFALAVLPFAYQYSCHYEKVALSWYQSFTRVIIGFLALFAIVATGETYPSYSIDVRRGQNIFCDQFNINCKKKTTTNVGEEKYYLCSETGSSLGDSILYDEIEVFPCYPPCPEFIMVQEQGKYGVIDSSGRVLLPAQYEEIDYNNRLFNLVNEDSLIVVKINSNGEREIRLIEDSLTRIEAIHPNIYFRTELQQADGSYLIKLKGERITPYAYFKVRNGIMEIGWRRGNTYVPYWYKGLTDYSQRSHYTVVSPNGVLLENISASELAAFKDFLITKVRPKYGDKITLDRWRLGGEEHAFDELIPNFTDARDRVITVRDNLWGIMDTLGYQIIPPKHKRIMPYSEGLAGFQSLENSRYGFIDLNGDEVISAKYEYVGDFDFGLAPVQRKGPSGKLLFGYINKAGEFIIDPQFDEAFGFNKEGWALVRINGEYFYVNQELTARNSAKNYYRY